MGGAGLRELFLRALAIVDMIRPPSTARMRPSKRQPASAHPHVLLKRRPRGGGVGPPARRAAGRRFRRGTGGPPAGRSGRGHRLRECALAVAGRKLREAAITATRPPGRPALCPTGGAWLWDICCAARVRGRRCLSHFLSFCSSQQTPAHSLPARSRKVRLAPRSSGAWSWPQGRTSGPRPCCVAPARQRSSHPRRTGPAALAPPRCKQSAARSSRASRWLPF